VLASGVKLHTIANAKPKETIAETNATCFAAFPERAVTKAPSNGKNIRSSKSCSIMFS
jgi:hypothetical protein